MKLKTIMACGMDVYFDYQLRYCTIDTILLQAFCARTIHNLSKGRLPISHRGLLFYFKFRLLKGDNYHD